MTKPVLRAATRADIPDLRAVLEGTDLFPPEMLQDLMEPFLSGTDEDFWLTVTTDGTAAGLCWCRPEPLTDGTWNMLALGVLPARHGQGLGAALAASAETRLRETGQRMLIVDTSGSSDFEGARTFYRACNYKQVAVIPDYWAAGDDKVTFCKMLQ
ncbi:GNAT family N-acetyltransferase [uncultured Roseobacter sp.]|uniref:GNAT family N-acetyltransferase n=1 Tax=uncultured Roseobacter sp. TaxID=114847 RepID=UPI00262F2E1F|nr:GNAT family N-acetyltransferase [uncultured Roseobacter sp.]